MIILFYHAAINATSTVFDLSFATSSKFFPTKTFTGSLSQSSGTSCERKYGFSFPSKYASTNVFKSVAVISDKSGLYLVESSVNVTKRTAGRSDFSTRYNSSIDSYSASSESTVIKST